MTEEKTLLPEIPVLTEYLQVKDEITKRLDKLNAITVLTEDNKKEIKTSIAEINRLLDGSNDILVNFELNNDINSAKADEIVKMFDSNGFSIFDSKETEPQITFAGRGTKALTDNQQNLVYIDVVDEKVKAKNSYFS